MDTTHRHVQLTAIEIANLWNSYIFESLVHHMFTYFLQHIDDPDIKNYVLQCQEKSKEDLSDYIEVFNTENIPVPRGTTSEDINLSAPRLFSDVFYIKYIKNMARFALTQFSIAYTEATRLDIRELYRDHLIKLIEVDKIGTAIMLAKGIITKAPTIPLPKEIHFVEERKLFDGFFSKSRPLSVLEISRLFSNSKNNAFAKALMMAFSQVTKSEDIHRLFIKGQELSEKLYKMFAEVLMDDDISTPRTFDNEIYAAGEPLFSERLMLNHVTFLNSFGFSAYGMSLSNSQRTDLITMYARILAEVGKYGKQCCQLLIKYGWLEEPPLAPNRKSLSNLSKKG